MRPRLPRRLRRRRALARISITVKLGLSSMYSGASPRRPMAWLILGQSDSSSFPLRIRVESTRASEHRSRWVTSEWLISNEKNSTGVRAAMEARTPVLFFSLEMSHSEVTQRLLCSEARVDSTRIRNGKLLESDWPKISHAIGRLGEAPLYIDDNPNLTVMEIRAKARRLRSRLGNLGLIVVDYLQLMSGRHSAENRQVEV